MKKLILLLIIVVIAFLLFSCDKPNLKTPKKSDGSNYSLVIQIRNYEKAENWYNNSVTITSLVGCDSLNMVTDKECIIFKNGTKMTIKASKSISVYTP